MEQWRVGRAVAGGLIAVGMLGMAGPGDAAPRAPGKARPEAAAAGERAPEGLRRSFRGLAAGLRAAAQDGPVEAEEDPELLTDRPDFTETSFVVPRGRVQVEGGFTYTEEAESAGHVLNLPELLIRYGVGRRTELRLGVPDYIRTRLDGVEGDDLGDTYLGFKQQLGPDGAGYGVALIPAVTLPTGGKRVSSDDVDPEVVVTWSRDLAEAWGLGGILGFAWPTEEGERRFTFFPTVSLARSLTDRVGTFLEWAAEFPEASAGEDVHLLHHGYTYALGPDSQADVHFGFGLSRAAPDWFVGAGFAVRR